MNKPNASAVAMWTAIFAIAATMAFLVWAGVRNEAAEDAEQARRDERLAEAVARLDGARTERRALAQLVESLRLNLRESNRRLRQAGEPAVPVPRLDPDDPDPDDAELQEPEVQEPERQEAEKQQRELQHREVQEADPDDPESQDEEVQQPEEQDAEEQEPEIQESEVDDPDPDDPETQEPEQQDPEEQDPERDDPDPDTPNPPASLTFNFGPPFGSFVCERSGGTDADPTYTCEQAA